MDSYNIGISGLNAAQKAFDVIGNNIANAATDGYHRQSLELTPAYSWQFGSTIYGGGVDVAEVTRNIDQLLENEILRQQSSLGQISRELSTLQTIEASFGELSSAGGLSAAVDDFFNALQDLSAHPSEAVWQEQVISTALNMSSRFQMMDDTLLGLETQIRNEADSIIEHINTIVEAIAQLNDRIERMEISGAQANNIRDQRDQYISELSELISIQTQEREYGVVDITVAGIPILTNTSTIPLEVGYNENHVLGISVANEFNYHTDIEGGKLGGLFSLANTLVSDIHDRLNNLVATIIQEINQFHVQGIGSQGSFSEMTGWNMSSEDLSDFQPAITDGKFYIRVTNTNTGEITRAAIDIDVSEDSLESIAADITAVTGISAAVISSKLYIDADSGYVFDFTPALLPTPENSDFTGTASPPEVTVSGLYSGDTNQIFTFTIEGAGSIGNGTLRINVTDESGSTVKIIDIGSGYAAGDKLEVCDGIEIALGTGDLVDGNSFEVEALASSDTSGFLAAVGINTFFSGSNAGDITVNSDICDTPGLLAAAIGSDFSDNKNILRMAGLRDMQIAGLDSLTPSEYYQKLVTDIGLEISVKNIQGENIQATIQNLSNQQSELSGVNINDEAAQMLIFEQMFQAMAKYMGTIQSSLTTIMDLL